jgi:excisionase family DNA binding protein
MHAAAWDGSNHALEEAAAMLEARAGDANAWLTIPPGATYLNVSTRTVRRLIASRALKSKLVGRVRRVSREAIAEFIEDAPE